MSGVNSSVASTGGQKLSMLAGKSGFVIPKNKLSGSLVRIFKGPMNHGATGTSKEEISKQIHRKTKWGPDLTQDAAVRRGRALALKIRVDQITHQLKSKKSEAEDTEDSSLGAKNLIQSHTNMEIDDKSEMLEHEKREAIGEILRLDPSYKPPLGFKPLLKEANVPLPVKEYPGFNFISLIYGPEGDNHKRVEKETGAKIEIHGVKAGEKAEIKPGSDIHGTYEEMHVIVSADCFEKVDAAVSIIELLITSVTGNLAATTTAAMSVPMDNTNVPGENVNHPPSHPIPVSMENQAMAQPVAGVTQTLGDHFQHSGPWLSAISSQNPVLASSGNIASPNPSGLPRPLHFPSQSMNSSNITSTFAAQHATLTGFNSVVPNLPVVRSQSTREHFQHSLMNQTSPVGLTGPPRNPSMVAMQTSSIPTNVSVAFPLNRSQPGPVGHQTSGPLMPQPMSGTLPAPVPDRSLTSIGSSSGVAGVSSGPCNLGQGGPAVIPPPRPVSLHVQPDVAFKPPVSNTSHPPTCPPHLAGTPPGLPSSLGPMQPPGPVYSSINHLSGAGSFPSPRLPTSLPVSQQSGIPNPASGVTYPGSRPPSSGLNSGNFIFQQQQPNADFQVVSRSNAAPQGGAREQSSGSWPPSFGFTFPDQPVNQVYPRTQVHNQVDQTKTVPCAGPFGGGPGSIPIPPRHTALPFASQPDPKSPVPQMATMNFFPSPQVPNFPNPSAPRIGTMQIWQNHPTQRWPEIPMPPNHKFGSNQLVTSGKPIYPSDQIYDPFSPTSVAAPQPKRDPAKREK